MPPRLPGGIKESCWAELTSLESLLSLWLLKGTIKKIPHWTNNEDEKLQEHRGGFIVLFNTESPCFLIVNRGSKKHYSHYTNAETMNQLKSTNN